MHRMSEDFVIPERITRSYLGQSLEARINLRGVVMVSLCVVWMRCETPYINYTVADSWVHTDTERINTPQPQKSDYPR
jgi:hypothetical protein